MCAVRMRRWRCPSFSTEFFHRDALSCVRELRRARRGENRGRGFLRVCVCGHGHWLFLSRGTGAFSAYDLCSTSDSFDLKPESLPFSAVSTSEFSLRVSAREGVEVGKGRWLWSHPFLCEGRRMLLHRHHHHTTTAKSEQ